MPRAVFKNGRILPLEPLPSEWTDGQELVVQKAEKRDVGPTIEVWAQEMDALCANSDPKDEARLLAAIDEQRREAKAQARREMGLPE